MPRGHGVTTRTGFMLRDWLYRVGKGSATGFHEYLKADSDLVKYSIGSRHTVSTLFYLLKTKLNLIVAAGEQVSKKPNHMMLHLYAIRPGYGLDMAWEDIFKFSYPESYKNNENQLIYWRMRKAMNRSIDVKTFEKERDKYA